MMASSQGQSEIYEPVGPYQGYQSTDGSGGQNDGGQNDGDRQDEYRPLMAASGAVPIPTREDAETVSKFLKIESHEIFVEAEGTQSLPQVFDISMLVYTATKKWVYIIFTSLFALLFAFIWGFIFALFSFVVVWMINPALRLFYIVINIWARAWAVAIHASFDPCYLSAALFWSRMRITLNTGNGSRPSRPILNM